MKITNFSSQLIKCLIDAKNEKVNEKRQGEKDDHCNQNLCFRLLIKNDSLVKKISRDISCSDKWSLVFLSIKYLVK